MWQLWLGLLCICYPEALPKPADAGQGGIGQPDADAGGEE